MNYNPNILHHVLGIVGAVDDAMHVIRQPRLVQLHELSKCRQITGLSQCDQHSLAGF